MSLALPQPPEPVDIKELIRNVKEGLSNGREEIDRDAIAVWHMNRLPKYLWDSWGDHLKKIGITWQFFVKVLRYHTIDMILWAIANKLSWSEFLDRVVSTLEYYIARKQESTSR